MRPADEDPFPVRQEGDAVARAAPNRDVALPAEVVGPGRRCKKGEAEDQMESMRDGH